MTAIHRVFLFCDDCVAVWDNDAVPSARTATEARAEAKRGGWVHRKGRDLCPDSIAAFDAPA